MGIGRFSSSDSPSKKPPVESDVLRSSTPPGPQPLGKNRVVALVGHRFKRMNEAHDRIRSAVLGSQRQNAR